MSTTPIYDELASRYLDDQDTDADEPGTGDAVAHGKPVSEVGAPAS